jgi:hypothetical protein
MDFHITKVSLLISESVTQYQKRITSFTHYPNYSATQVPKGPDTGKDDLTCRYHRKRCKRPCDKDRTDHR